jgi:hypothetical protein
MRGRDHLQREVRIGGRVSARLRARRQEPEHMRFEEHLQLLTQAADEALGAHTQPVTRATRGWKLA